MAEHFWNFTNRMRNFLHFLKCLVFMKKSWKIKNFRKVQNFPHSIWKVPKMFCHLEIHWGALGRRSIDHEISIPKNYFFLNKVYISKICASGPQIPSQCKENVFTMPCGQRHRSGGSWKLISPDCPKKKIWLAWLRFWRFCSVFP